jgi:hypothetical protein
MSDYLWDRSGEPEAEVTRLEELLGPLRHAGVAPELPSDVEKHAPAHAHLFRTASFLRLAAAAALLLAALAGALVMLRSALREEGHVAPGAAQFTRPQTDSPEEQRAREAASASKQTDAPEKLQAEPARRDEFAGTQQQQPKERGREPSPRWALTEARAQRALKALPSNGGARAEPRLALARAEGPGGEAFDLESRVRAKEQLVYALRLTSETLKEVRGRASGFDGRANAPEGRSPLR